MMMKALRKLAAAFISLSAALMSVCCVSAAAPNGISVSASTVKPGEIFTVTLYVPPAQNADTVSVRAEFDSSAFEVKSWAPSIANGISNHGDDFFSVAAASAVRSVDLSSGLVLKAEMAVKKGTADGSYKIKLVKKSFSYYNEDTSDYVELWKPGVTEVSVNVNSKSSGGQNGGNGGQSGGNGGQSGGNGGQSGGNGGQNGGNGGQSGGNGGQGGTSTDKTNENTSGGNKAQDKDNKQTKDDKQDKNTEKDEKTSADNAKEQESTVSKAKIKFINGINELSEGKVTIATKAMFFSGDARIEITHTQEAQEAAARAIENLGLTGHDYYAFDISIYDVATGAKIRSLADGYVRLRMPLPLKFAGITEGLAVYHTESGFPQRIASEIIYEDGQPWLVFTINSFSPYMITDTVHKAVFSPQTASNGAAPGNVNDNTGKEAAIVDPKTAKPAGKPLNPGTGVTAAIVIPAAMTCCVFLARKQNKKRRRARRNDPEDCH